VPGRSSHTRAVEALSDGSTGADALDWIGTSAPTSAPFGANRSAPASGLPELAQPTTHSASAAVARTTSPGVAARSTNRSK
jgi:hypothetical protein